MKVLSTDGLTKLIELIKNGFISVDDTVTTSTMTLATVATSGDFNDLINKPSEVTKNYYGTCATGASTQAKVVVCEGFVLETGVSIRVKFTNAQTYNGQPTLNVNSTGAIPVTSAGTTAAARYHWLAGEVVAFTYDGTNWIMEDGGIATTTYYGYTKLTTNATSTSTATALTPSSLNSLVQNMIEPYPVYSTSATYAVGDRVRRSYEAYECTTAITTPEAWNADHWTALDPIQTQIDNLNAKGGRNVGEIIQSSLPLTDAGLHLLDGTLLPYGIYKEFVDYIAALYGDGTNIPSYFCTETEWQQSVTDYGVCGKFVYDSVNNTVRLPKITGIVEGTTDLAALGNLVQAGLPDPLIDIVYREDSTSSGVYTDKYGTDGYTGPSYTNTSGTDEYMQSSLDKGASAPFGAVCTNPIYGNSDTVQPQTIKAFYYIVIATSSKTDIQVDIDNIATDLNGKADTDLENTTTKLADSFLSKIMPDYENQVTGSGGNWVQCSKDSFICIWGDDPFTEDYYCYVSPDNGTTTYMVGRRYDDTNGNTEITSFTFLCPKNWYFRCTSEHTPSYCIYPLKGAN